MWQTRGHNAERSFLIVWKEAKIAVAGTWFIASWISLRRPCWRLAVKVGDIQSTSSQNFTVRPVSLSNTGVMQSDDIVYSCHHQKKRI
jgi:hypothetical protein